MTLTPRNMDPKGGVRGGGAVHGGGAGSIRDLLTKSLGFHFSLMNMIPMMALAGKKPRREKRNKVAARWRGGPPTHALWVAHLYMSPRDLNL